jgi:D-3-phosphoglycerate dehydrogenase
LSLVISSPTASRSQPCRRTHVRRAGAALDVFEPEPPRGDHPLFALEDLILSPHRAGLSKEAAIRMAISTTRNGLAGIDGKLDHR